MRTGGLDAEAVDLLARRFEPEVMQWMAEVCDHLPIVEVIETAAALPTTSARETYRWRRLSGLDHRSALAAGAQEAS